MVKLVRRCNECGEKMKCLDKPDNLSGELFFVFYCNNKKCREYKMAKFFKAD